MTGVPIKGKFGHRENTNRGICCEDTQGQCLGCSSEDRDLVMHPKPSKPRGGHKPKG